MFTKMFGLQRSLVLLSTLTTFARAQLSLPPSFPSDLTPVFTPEFDVNLFVPASNQTITTTTSGILVTIPDAALPPSLIIPAGLPPTVASPLLLIMLDPDAPTPDNPNRITILHALQTDLTPSVVNPLQLTSAVRPITPYRGPGPPAGSAPHRYIFLFYSQPPNFALPTAFNATQRAGFNLTAFVAESGLGSPVASVFFTSVRDTPVTPPVGTIGNVTTPCRTCPGPSNSTTPTPIDNVTTPCPTCPGLSNSTTPAPPVGNIGNDTTPCRTCPGPSNSTTPTPTNGNSTLTSGLPGQFDRSGQGWNSTNPTIGGGRNGTGIDRPPGPAQTGGLVVAPPFPSGGLQNGGQGQGSFGGEVGTVGFGSPEQGVFNQGSGGGRTGVDEKVWWTIFGAVGLAVFWGL